MIPYIIINGISSRNINGLLIQSLPPITKPKMRTSIEDIDGRDGDVVTTLGFSAYDKPVTVGLKGDFNIDDVISFFNSKGKVVFSNELDKYYNFAVYDTIDFNRLLRYRTANINLHVQPFKYSNDEPPITEINTDNRTIAELEVRNTGNIYSRPKLSITGRNTITVYIENVQIFNIILSAAGETIIIDDFNATDGAGNYLNRKVTGDYENLKLPAGANKIIVTGNYESITVERYSRWI